MLAGELALAGVDVAIVERRNNQELVGARALGLHSRTIEVLDQRGIAERFLSQGRAVQNAGFAWIRLDISDLPTRHNYGLALEQVHTERILAGWVDELKVPIYRGREVAGFTQDEGGVDVEVLDGASLALLRAKYLVGCDGGRSLVRKMAGIDFAGWDATTSHLIAEVELTDQPEWGLRNDGLGIRAFSKVEGGRTVRVLVTERQVVGDNNEPGLSDLREALVAVYGTDYGAHSPTWISRFTDMSRQAALYRKGRVLLAGDSAHVHYPAGGQGLNTGVQDAVNLGWKLAQVVAGTSPESLLDTYHDERHPVAARVLRNTMAQVALLCRADERTGALRDTVAEFLGMDEPRRRLAAEMVGLSIFYDFGGGHPLVGRRMPDLELIVDGGTVRAFTLLHGARPVLLNFGHGAGLDVWPWADRVRMVGAKYGGEWRLSAIGTVSAPEAVLVRPDGHVAWVGDSSRVGLDEAMTRWFGRRELEI
jgi:2-polyprenyl-6-methoxyphenol hydroxylase-like FAD-dependent oxidoreductase